MPVCADADEGACSPATLSASAGQATTAPVTLPLPKARTKFSVPGLMKKTPAVASQNKSLVQQYLANVQQVRNGYIVPAQLTRACMHACMHASMYICMYVCLCLCVYVCMYVCMYVRMYVCVYTAGLTTGQPQRRFCGTPARRCTAAINDIENPNGYAPERGRRRGRRGR